MPTPGVLKPKIFVHLITAHSSARSRAHRTTPMTKSYIFRSTNSAKVWNFCLSNWSWQFKTNIIPNFPSLTIYLQNEHPNTCQRQTPRSRTLITKMLSYIFICILIYTICLYTNINNNSVNIYYKIIAFIIIINIVITSEIVSFLNGYVYMQLFHLLSPYCYGSQN